MAALVNRLAGFPVTSPRRLRLGLLLNLAGLFGLAVGLAVWLAERILPNDGAREALLASLMAGAATGIGALALAVLRRPDAGQLERFMLLAAGMMLAATAFALLVPAVEVAIWPFALDVVVAAGAGALLMRALDRALPHRHPADAGAGRGSRNALVLVVVAIAVHNLPEGFAVGAGFGGGAGFGWSTAASIGVQNIPEGLIVATALWSLGLRRRMAALGALATGLVEPVGAALGIVASGISVATLPMALGLAGGAMLFVVVHEAAPAALRAGPDAVARWRAAWPFAAGFAAMGLVGLV